MSTDTGGGSPAPLSSSAVVPFIRNFRNGSGWESVNLSGQDIEAIQQRIRQFNAAVLKESMQDAQEVVRPLCGLYEARTERICELAMFLAGSRVIDSRTAYDESQGVGSQARRQERRMREGLIGRRLDDDAERRPLLHTPPPGPQYEFRSIREPLRGPAFMVFARSIADLFRRIRNRDLMRKASR
jgi:hypothetical protein